MASLILFGNGLSGFIRERTHSGADLLRGLCVK